MRACKLLFSIASLWLGLLPALAHADGAKIHLERADVSRYPTVRLYMTYVEQDGRLVTGKQRDDFKLIFDSNEQGYAADVKTIEQTSEPIYMVIVAQSSGAMSEVFDDEKRGIKNLARAASELPGSQVALIGYAQDTKRVAELGKPAAIDGAAGGLQIDADGTEVHLLDAVRTAIDLLNAKGVPDEARKLIVVFSDGIDVAGGEKRAFTELGKRALFAGIVIDTIGYAPFEPAKLRNLNEMSKQSNGTERACKNAQDVIAQFDNAADAIKKQYVAVFDSAIAGQGKEHTLQVVDDKGGRAVYSNNVTKICLDHGPVVQADGEKRFYQKWWFWVFCVSLPLILIVLFIVGLVLSKKRSTMGVEVGPSEVAAAGPMRTMALDVGTLGGKGPAIGWIVGISGKNIDKTFKLKPSLTVIGTAPDCDVVVDDSFMSTKHCEVRYDGVTYKIVDLGSTNGVVLNDKKVREHDLIDGDTLRLGRSEFKFKSIN